MPELPEVERARRQLEKVAVGKEIEFLTSLYETDFNVFDDTTRRKDYGLESIVGKKVVSVGRKGKQLWIELSSKPHLVLHFGMTGGISVKNDPDNFTYMGQKSKKQKVTEDEPADWPPRFTKMEVILSEKYHIAYTDPRRFGKIGMCDIKPIDHPAVSKLGFDCLYQMPSQEEFQALVDKNRKASTIKGLLLDQSFSAGVGNWIADECLYDARLHPSRPVKSLSSEEIECLRTSLERIVRQAVDANNDHTKYPPTWLFHLRWNSRGRAKNGETSDGVRVKMAKIAGRSTLFAPSLQIHRKTRPGKVENDSSTNVENGYGQEDEHSGSKDGEQNTEAMQESGAPGKTDTSQIPDEGSRKRAWDEGKMNLDDEKRSGTQGLRRSARRRKAPHP